MDIIFNPSVNEENQYIQLLVAELRNKGYRIHGLESLFSGFRHFRSIKLVHLNWFENVDDSSFFIAARSFIRKLVALVAIRLSGKRLVWTMHNSASHEKGLAFFSRTITRLLVRWSHRIIIHTKQSENILAAFGTAAARKAVYLSHPHFIGVYGEMRTVAEPDRSTLHLLFVGMVKPYKNLELLIDVLRDCSDQVHLTIAGKAVDAGYERQIRHMANRAGNVELIPYFVPDDEMALLIASADALVLPYDLSSSLNSGTAILAFSYGKTVICPAIGTITDLGTHQRDVFHYSYNTHAEHHEALRQQVMHAVELKQRDPQALAQMGKRLREYVAIEYDKQVVGAGLHDVYRKLLGNDR